MKEKKSTAKIDPELEYRPREIADNGWILNTRRKPDYYFILKMIKNGKLPARNIALSGENPYFVVLGQDILNYQESIKKRVQGNLRAKKKSKKRKPKE